MKSAYNHELDILVPATATTPAQTLKHHGNHLTTYEAPFVHYGCQCQRQFVGEDFYLCFKCAKIVCQFCVSQDEIETFYCRFCLDTQSAYEAQQYRNHCSRYTECPVCFSNLQITMMGASKKDQMYFYACNYCHWETFSLGLKSKLINGLLQKFTFYKGRYFKSPHQELYQRLLELYNWQIDEQLKLDQQEV